MGVWVRCVFSWKGGLSGFESNKGVSAEYRDMGCCWIGGRGFLEYEKLLGDFCFVLRILVFLIDYNMILR